jgi:hypothetical protein
MKLQLSVVLSVFLIHASAFASTLVCQQAFEKTTRSPFLTATVNDENSLSDIQYSEDVWGRPLQNDEKIQATSTQFESSLSFSWTDAQGNAALVLPVGYSTSSSEFSGTLFGDDPHAPTVNLHCQVIAD